MNREPLTCLACGVTGPGVRPCLAFYEDPRPVTVFVPVAARAGAIEEPRVVPERYGAEYRCTDVPACRARVAALEPMETNRPTSGHGDPAEPAEEASWF